MKPEELLSVLHTANRLKGHHPPLLDAWEPSRERGRPQLAAGADGFFLRDEFPETDMDKVIKMCLIHDLGECFTGDIPSFLKTDADTAKEDALLINGWRRCPSLTARRWPPCTRRWTRWRRRRPGSTRRWTSWRPSSPTTSPPSPPGCPGVRPEPDLRRRERGVLPIPRRFAPPSGGRRRQR